MSRSRTFGPWSFPISQWGAPGSSTKRLRGVSRAKTPRLLRMESLERRVLLSVAQVAMEFKTLPFNVRGNVVSNIPESGYLFHLTGSASLTGGAINYDSAMHGTLSKSAVLSVKNGAYTATQKNPSFRGTWGMSGKTLNMTDQSGRLSGRVNVGRSYVRIPTMPSFTDYFNGTYRLSKATLNTSNFNLRMDLIHTEDGSKITFKGKLALKGKAFGVAVKPTWNAGATAVDVEVSNLDGRPHATASRGKPVANVRWYWANGTSFKKRMGGPLADSIPFYWNERYGKYEVANLPAAPASATHLLFVTTIDGKTTTKALALPKVSVSGVATPEGGDSGGANAAENKVVLSQAYSSSVSVSPKTIEGLKLPAQSTCDNAPKSGSAALPGGATPTTMEVVIRGDAGTAEIWAASHDSALRELAGIAGMVTDFDSLALLGGRAGEE